MKFNLDLNIEGKDVYEILDITKDHIDEKLSIIATYSKLTDPENDLEILELLQEQVDYKELFLIATRFIKYINASMQNETITSLIKFFITQIPNDRKENILSEIKNKNLLPLKLESIPTIELPLKSIDDKTFQEDILSLYGINTQQLEVVTNKILSLFSKKEVQEIPTIEKIHFLGALINQLPLDIIYTYVLLHYLKELVDTYKNNN